ncbi:hypothetical protein [Acinetobacter colistiniresistens]|uniref:Lipoprotein n=1 Tax=Acinetobacter colistiniresistens TaxID=280145 RepID=S3TFH4_9GAMM|nr:hypothetical protein [Acinetobacter colistiniresistens]EPG39663.1 hypothetical protein F907_00970 [Acinetobacter colistiniresistens]TVT85864.1 hypothetical protein FPV60_03895 [Acinetobacter colistiniresistens]
MNLKILSLCFVATFLGVGCGEQPNKIAEYSEARKQFDLIDQQINVLMDILDSPQTERAKLIKVLCHDYPEIFEKQYIPALLKLASKEYTEKQLRNELELVMSYYEHKLLIRCE